MKLFNFQSIKLKQQFIIDNKDDYYGHAEEESKDDDASSLSLSSSSSFSSLGYDVVYVDIGGLSGAYGILETLALVETISQSLQPKMIVVKSLCLQRLSNQLEAFSELLT